MALKKIASLLPEWIKPPLRLARDSARALLYYGTGRLCPVCNRQFRKFRRFGIEARKGAMCPYCGALERHRFVWLYFNQRTDLFDGRMKRMLHVAPEICLERKLKKRLAGCYLTADLYNPCAMVKMDIMDIHYWDESFDVIYCSHVLEHVANDRLAMKELHRVLDRKGWAILLVPITVDVTYEDPAIVEPKERLLAFGQEDHVRRYGPDYVARLEEAGFKVKITRVADMFAEEDVQLLGLTGISGEIYFCTK